MRYPQGYYAAPGGGIKEGESLISALKREVFEETAIRISVLKPIFIETLNGKEKIHLKTWFVCKYVKGEIAESEASREEGIVECDWYDQDFLTKQRVYPEILGSMSFSEILDFSQPAIVAELRDVPF